MQTPVLVSEYNDLSHGHSLGRGYERRRLDALMQLYSEVEIVDATYTNALDHAFDLEGLGATKARILRLMGKDGSDVGH